MQLSSQLEGFALDILPPGENGLGAAEVGIGRSQVVQAFVVAAVVVVIDELGEAGFQLPRQVVVSNRI